MKTSTQQLLSLLILPFSVIAAPAASLEARACTAVTVIFARGTTEIGTIGTVVGPPFSAALSSALGSGAVTFTGVPYAANVAGFLLGGDAAGSQKMADMVNSALSSCPSTKIVISGYSQGGQLVHKAAKLLSSETTAKISAAVIFGDPDNGSAVQGVSAARTDIICHFGDNICEHGDLILLPHLTYGLDATSAAAFVKKAVAS
ncbi:hypothetical protein NHQ30_001162 [Ciborinia camelliae]|nr:hypothetical protein NHQ30_001162 [Ciborinia camelliae]